MSNKICDTSRLKILENEFQKLTSGELHKIMFTALKRGGKVLRNATTQSIINSFGGNVANKTDRYGKSLLDGVGTKNDNTTCEVTVHIMRNYKLRFFENGTVLRTTKKGANRGSLSARKFFATANSSVSSQMEQTINDELNKGIKKILK